MNVRIHSKAGEMREGFVTFSADRRAGRPGKQRSVYVRFAEEIVIPYPHNEGFAHSRGEEFYLSDHGCARMIWGQGMEYPDDSWCLDAKDAVEILKGGGG